ncbi:MAG: hypothetical protein IJC65_06265 [Oscillospiraceae bacterium]|nr:hypothetical protein [Oscillospiraceae bacterium]
MKYLPILQELFESDSFLFLIAGLIVSLIFASRIKSRKNLMISTGCSLLLYVLCEAISNLHTNYAMELLFLIIGTAAIGSAIGFAVMLIILPLIRKEKEPR